MKDEEVIELRASEQARRQIMNRVIRAHVEGLDEEALDKLGFYDRISMLLSGMFTLQAVAYRLYGGIQYLLETIDANNKREIRVACNSFQQAYDSYLGFWSKYYMTRDGAQMEMNNESEALYHQFMRWAQLRESWSLGDPQRCEDNTESLMEYDAGDFNTLLKFYTSILNSEIVEEEKETWMVTRYNRNERKQFVVEEGLKKADAQMVAKRLSDNDKGNVFIVSKIRTYTEKKTEAIPFKAYQANKLVSSIRKTFKPMGLDGDKG